MSIGDQDSDEDELLYGVQNGAANLLLYVGLGTMCVGMIIAFVGTGEKGFKTMELRLIGPSLIGAGVLIIILRILLCICPSKCLHLKKRKQKLKNSTNKLNREENKSSQELSTSKEPLSEELKTLAGKSYDGKKRVSIVMLPTTSGLSTNFPTSSNNSRTPKPSTYPDGSDACSMPISFLENEKPSSSKSLSKKASKGTATKNGADSAGSEGKMEFELKELNDNDYDEASCGSQSSCRKIFSYLPETLVTPDNSDISITSLVNRFPESEAQESKKEEKPSASKYEMARNPKNVAPAELVLCPSNLNETRETE